MVLDSSALLAMLLDEPEADAISASLLHDPVHMVSSVTWLEAQVVVQSRMGTRGTALLDRLLQDLRISIVNFDPVHAQTAFAAWQRFGKGQHVARLNFVDCCAYATAILGNQPLLFKGNDFNATDVPRVSY
jgi:ribonuclease VapC